jgi:beta-glucosidase
MNKIVFPKDFIWGAATASYQVEGAVKQDGRGPSIWDKFSHTPGKVLGGHTGDIACDHYNRFKEDIKIMKELGLKSYRFSISWPRVFPEGKGKINQKGLDFYKNLVEELLKFDIQPAVTLYHWDLPQALQDSIGGWGSRDTIEYYVGYAACMFNVLGDRVKMWITHNEPRVVSFMGNATGKHAPGNKDYTLGVQASHHIILSHAKAVQTFRQINNGGKIGITLDLTFLYPASDSKEDIEALRIADGHINRWFLDPVFKGSYPEDMMKLYMSKLNAPVIYDDDMKIISSNHVDFLGINNYSRAVIKKDEKDELFGYQYIKTEGSDYTAMGWEIHPKSLYDLLMRIDREYNNPHIYITENGAAFKDDIVVNGIVKDEDRINYLKQYLTAANQAINDGVKLDGYYLWSLLDNFEWAYGYNRKYKKVIKENGF